MCKRVCAEYDGRIRFSDLLARDMLLRFCLFFSECGKSVHIKTVLHAFTCSI